MPIDDCNNTASNLPGAPRTCPQAFTGCALYMPIGNCNKITLLQTHRVRLVHSGNFASVTSISNCNANTASNTPGHASCTHPLAPSPASHPLANANR
eukprot:1151822-Pelagomonas_calceolata.AAC.3